MTSALSRPAPDAAPAGPSVRRPTAIVPEIQALRALAVAGVVFNVAIFLFLAPRIIGRYWFERGIGDFGQSIKTGESVTSAFVDKFPATMELGLMALLLAVVVGVPLGYLAARHQGRFLDSFVVSGSLLGVVTPVFFLAILLKLVFANWLDIFPSSQRQDVRIGRHIVIHADARDEGDAERAVRDMCERLLANPVTEDFEIGLP